MEITLKKPYLTSWLTIPVLILIGLTFNRHTIDIQLHDTYFVIANFHFALAGSLLLLLIGMGYWLINRRNKSPNQVLTAVHLLTTVSVLVVFATPVSADSLSLSAWFVWGTTLLLVAQLLYLVNILVSLIRE